MAGNTVAGMFPCGTMEGGGRDVFELRSGNPRSKRGVEGRVWFGGGRIRSRHQCGIVAYTFGDGITRDRCRGGIKGGYY